MIAALMAALDLAKATLMLLQMSLLLANPQPVIAQNNYISVPSTTPALVVNLSRAETSIQPAVFIPKNDPKKAIVDMIEEEASNIGVTPALAVKIAECESGFDPLARSSISTAKGLFQFINGTWITTMIKMGLPTSSDIFNPDIHIQAAIWLLSQPGGERHWDASRKCWSVE